MRVLRWLILPAFSVYGLRTRDHNTRDYFAVHLHQSADPNYEALQLGTVNEGPLGELPDHFTFSCSKEDAGRVELELQQLKDQRVRRRSLGLEDEGIKWHQRQVPKQRHVKRIPPAPHLTHRQAKPSLPELNEEQKADQARLKQIAADLKINDPIFQEQWHLFNYLHRGIDTNVTGLWLEGITGTGIVSSIVDDGLDFHSDDLKPNYYANGSWDYNNPGPDPLPRLSDDRHGTRCAGEIGAARNDVCGVGMAYDSKISGIRILSGQLTEEDEATAINYHYQENDIYSCSWGPPDDGRTMEAPGILVKKAFVNGIQKGRGGKGSVFVFAAGNGAAKEDNCNFDGYTNSIYSISTGAIDKQGNHPYYSEKCSALMIVTPSSGSDDAIHTTDVGTNQCYTNHGGTSAAGPLMAGAVALALSARPELSWRDVQLLALKTAIPLHLEEGDWQDTALGGKFSHTYGYGKLDTYSFVKAAQEHELLKPQAWFISPWLAVLHDIPEGDQGLVAAYEVSQDMLDRANFGTVEHVTVTMNVNHTNRGDMSVELHSPEGRISHIAERRRDDKMNAGYVDWTFMTVVHWGEKAVGTWKVIVKDTVKNEAQGHFIDWRLNLFGESIDASKQELLPLPDEHDDDHETATAIVSTTSVAPVTTTTELPEHPSDHPERPTRPDGVSVTTTSNVVTPITTQTQSSQEASTTSGAAASTHTVSDSFLPGFFPTFGVSQKTAIWIYGSFGLIVVFLASLGGYVLLQRRRRLRNSRDSYEFEMIHNGEDEARGLTGKGRRKRGGELYDAFAMGESDEDVFADESDGSDEEEGYQDTPADSNGSGGGSTGSPGHR